MKTIVFGVGNYYQEQKENINSFDEIEIIAFSDNNPTLWNQEIDGIMVIPPDRLADCEYDRILIMSIYVCDIYEQLLLLGVEETRIIIWDRFYKGLLHTTLTIPESIRSGACNKKVLIISQILGYDGGAYAAIYAAHALQQNGMSVILLVPGGNKQLIEETVKSGIEVVIQPSLPYILETDKPWIGQFDVVIVNLLTMIESAYEISQFCPVLWWIHEATVCYRPVMAQYPSAKHVNDMPGIHIYAVSSIAMNNFNHFFGIGRCKKILTIGIPDMADQEETIDANRDSTVAAIIGPVNSLKAQDIFLKAVSMLEDTRESEFWIIGKGYDQCYFENIKKMAAGIKSVKILGEMTREEIDRAFHKIDVLVCASHEETLSITVIEAMMYGKVCITTNAAGAAQYIENGVNGFVIPSNNADALKEKLEWILKNITSLDSIRMNARKTYEKNFNMRVFGRNLERALDSLG